MLAQIVVASFLWCQGGFANWGQLSVGLLCTWTIWLLCRISAGSRTVPGNPVHLILAAMGGMLLVSMGVSLRISSDALSGAMELSVLFHLGLLALAVLLIQSLLTLTRRLHVFVGTCGLALIGGPMLSLAFQPRLYPQCLALIAWAGVCLWSIAPAVMLRQWPALDARHRAFAIFSAAVSAAAAAALIVQAPASSVAGIKLALAGGLLAFAVRGGRWARPLSTVAIILFAAMEAKGLGKAFGPDWLAAPWVVMGRQAVRQAWQDSSGLGFVLLMTGRAGLLAVVAGVPAAMVLLLVRSRLGGSHPAATLWAAAAMLVLGALLADGGPFLPVCLVAFAAVWGVAHATLRANEAARGGIYVLAVLLLVLVATGIGSNGSLLSWSILAVGANDKAMHTAAGFFLAMTLLWLFARRRWGRGLVWLGISAAIGAVGEGAQGLVAWRGPDVDDFVFHAIGVVLAAGPYMLCVASAWHRRPDVGNAFTALDAAGSIAGELLRQHSCHPRKSGHRSSPAQPAAFRSAGPP